MRTIGSRQTSVGGWRRPRGVSARAAQRDWCVGASKSKARTGTLFYDLALLILRGEKALSTITATSIVTATRSPGGRGGRSIPSPRHGCSGFQRGASSELGAGRIESILSTSTFWADFGRELERRWPAVAHRRASIHLLRNGGLYLQNLHRRQDE